ncbi:MAG: hypothetical protein M5U26_11780 [Planctomycetota bacterium]|nr:hypothetical protein [Planctomycetota bacterium]
MPIGLIACCKKKLARAAPAGELYQSDLFKKSKSYVERHCERWAILSAKHGLVMPEQVIEPYDQTLNGMKASEVRAWADRTSKQLEIAFPGKDFLVLAGKRYRAATKPFKASVPLAGLSIGRQLSWLKESIGE